MGAKTKKYHYNEELGKFLVCTAEDEARCPHSLHANSEKEGWELKQESFEEEYFDNKHCELVEQQPKIKEVMLVDSKDNEFQIEVEETIRPSQLGFKIATISIKEPIMINDPERRLYVGDVIQRIYESADADSVEMDLRNLDVSGAYNLADIFYDFKRLSGVDVSNWDVSKIDILGGMFTDCTGINELDLSNWDVSNCEYFGGMFEGCGDLEEINVSTWKPAPSSNFARMFAGCYSLTTIDMSSWSVSSGNFYETFSGCEGLESLYFKTKKDASHVVHYRDGSSIPGGVDIFIGSPDDPECIFYKTTEDYDYDDDDEDDDWDYD